MANYGKDLELNALFTSTMKESLEPFVAAQLAGANIELDWLENSIDGRTQESELEMQNRKGRIMKIIDPNLKADENLFDALKESIEDVENNIPRKPKHISQNPLHPTIN